MNILSLFDGISGGQYSSDIGNHVVDNYFASEIEKDAIEITMNQYPNTIQLGDVNNVDLKSLPKIDLLIGGSPCQGFSRNGKQLNFEDPRSILFFKYCETLDWIRENNNPNVYFLLENVHMKKEWRNLISKYLGVGYLDINSRLLTAQNRPRLYWTNIPNVTIPTQSNLNLIDVINTDLEFESDNYCGLKIDKDITLEERKLISVVNGEVRIKQPTKQEYIIAEHGDGVNLSFPKSTTRRGRVIKQKTPTLDCACNVCVYYKNVIRKLTINEIELIQGFPIDYTAALDSRSARKKAIGNGWSPKIIEHIFSFLPRET